MINKLTLPWPVLFLEFFVREVAFKGKELFVLHYQQMPIFIPVGQKPCVITYNQETNGQTIYGMMI